MLHQEVITISQTSFKSVAATFRPLFSWLIAWPSTQVELQSLRQVLTSFVKGILFSIHQAVLSQRKEH